MAKGSAAKKKVQDLFVPAELNAAVDVGIVLTSDFVRRVRTTLKDKAQQVKGLVQYYAIMDDAVWDHRTELDDRIFAAVRLVYEYKGHNSREIAQRDVRVDALKTLILRLADEKQVDLPVVRKIKAHLL